MLKQLLTATVLLLTFGAANAQQRAFLQDAAHQLVRSVGPDGETTYQYDAWGRRVREVGPRGTTVYRWDVVGRLVGIDDGERSLVVEVDLDGLPRRVGAVPVDWDVSGPVPRLVGVGDVPVLQLADVTGYIGSGGEIQWYVPRSQDVWGTTFGPALAADVSLHPFGGLGVGRLVYLGDRVYDPQTRQFLTRDPLPGLLGEAASQVPYAYANNDPVNLVDPTGRRPLSRDEFDEIQDRYTGPQWGNIAYAVAIVAGTVLVAVTLGAAAGPLALALAGAAVGGGSRLIQGAVNAGTHKGSGKIEWGDVLKDTAVGFLAGGAGGYIGKAVGPAGEAVFGTGSGGRVITGGAEGTIDGVTSGVIGETYDGVGLPGGDGRFDPDAVVINGVVGGVGGAGKGAIPTKPLDGPGSGHGHGGGRHGSSRAPVEPDYTTGGKVGQGSIDAIGDLLVGGFTGG